MKKRRGFKKKEFTDELFAEDEGECNLVNASILRVEHVSSKTKRRNRKKTLKKLENIQFLNVCDKYLASKSHVLPKVLPEILPQFCSNPEILNFLSAFVNNYINVFDVKQLRRKLSEFYDPSAYLTFQIAPYVCQSSLNECSDKSYRPKYQPLWATYERFAVNSLPGGFPLPSWAWFAVKEESMPRRLRGPSLCKQDRKLLKSLKGYQMGHIQRLVSVTRSASSASDRSITNIPPPPIARMECRGSDQVLGLLCRLPDLVHVRSDRYSHLDVIWSELPLVCMRYSCIAAESVPQDTRPSDLEGISDQLLNIAPYGNYAVRLVCRMLILHQSGKILQEDWCVTPLPSSYLQECSLIITEAVSNFMTSRTPSTLASTLKPGGMPDDSVCSKLVEELSIATGMNKAYSLQCLTECRFDLDSALHSFQKPSAGWKASKQNRFKSISDVYNTFGYYGIRHFRKGILSTISHEDENIQLPDYFDSREQWKDCPSINIIHDQSKCDSGWAVASAASISDRTCIQTNGTMKVQLSAIELISCSKNKLGCQIGFSEFSWDYWLKNGLVTGDPTGCLPYPFPKCDHRSSNSYPKCGYITYTAPPCTKTCRSGYPIPYKADKHYGRVIYSLRPNESDIRKEIMMNGPVEAGIFVHSDFLNYKSGVYRHITGQLVTIHSVRIIGWGIENDIPYWLCANSWNEDWGLNGYFKILRGSNECEIESFVNAGKVDNKT